MPKKSYPIVCKISNNITPMDTKNKWFMNFFISLLNDFSHMYITEKDYKRSDTFQNEIKTAIANNMIYDFLNDPITQSNLTIIHSKILVQKKNTDIFIKWLEDNNYIIFFLFPYFIKFLKFKCITFEYCQDKLYGGVYNHLKKNIVTTYDKNYLLDDYMEYEKYEFITNSISINQSNGFDYEYNENRHPEFLLINVWDNEDNLNSLGSLDIIDIDTYTNTETISKKLVHNREFNPTLEYNGYKYYLRSCLLNNFNDLKKPSHTITIIWCGNKKYAYTNSFINKSTTMYNPANILKTLIGKKEVPCTDLIELNVDIYTSKGLSLSDNECGLFTVRGNDLSTKYCYSLSKGKRVLIYVREAEEVKLKRDKDEQEAKEKQEREEELQLKVIDKLKDKDKKKQETDDEKKARIEKENKDRVCKLIFDYVDKIRTKIDKKDIEDKIKKEKDYITAKVKELEDKEKNYDVHKKELEKMKTDIEKMHKDNLEELKKYIETLKTTKYGVV